MKKSSKFLAICLLVITFSIAIGGVIFAANQTATGTSDTNVVLAIEQAKMKRAIASEEASIYRNALRGMQLNYWIAFLTIMSLAFLALIAVVLFVQSRKRMAEKTATAAGGNIK